MFQGRPRSAAPAGIPTWLLELLVSGESPVRGALGWREYLKLRFFDGPDALPATWLKLRDEVMREAKRRGVRRPWGLTLDGYRPRPTA